MEIHDSRKEKEKPLIQNVSFRNPNLKIHDARDNKFEKNSFKLLLFYQKHRKKIKWVVLGVIVILTILFPVWSGTMIGNWIKYFIGTIINIVKTI